MTELEERFTNHQRDNNLFCVEHECRLNFTVIHSYRDISVWIKVVDQLTDRLLVLQYFALLLVVNF